MKKVSIIVPVYGVEKYIDKCLNSLVNQSLEDIEIIVVNDGTKDNSQEIIDRYVKKYPNKIKSFIKENGGLGSARNYGIKVSTGKYIGFVDSDDFVSENMFEELYKKAIKDKLDVTVCNIYELNENNGKRTIDEFKIFDDNQYDSAFFGKIAVWNKLYKTDLLKNNNICFKEKVWYEDLAFTCKVIMQAKKIGFIDIPCYNYLIREGSIMNNKNVQRNLEILDAFNDILKYMKDNDLERFYPYIEYLAIYNVYIATTVRIITSGNIRENKDIINKIIEYMEENFPHFRQNRYLYLLDKNKKIIYNLIRLKYYFIIKLIFKIKRSLQ